MDLEKIWHISALIEKEQNRLDVLRASVERITAPMDGLPPAGDYSDRLASLAARIVDTESFLAALKTELSFARAEMSAALMSLDLPAATLDVLVMRYVDCLPFAQIVATLNYSEAHIYYLHRQGKRAAIDSGAFTVDESAGGDRRLDIAELNIPCNSDWPPIA